MGEVIVPSRPAAGADGSGTDRKQPLFGRYELGRLLGQGTFAKVYHAKHVETGESVAVKVISKDHVQREPGMMAQIVREISVMRLVRHPNVVDLKEVMATRGRIYFVMELVRGGELFAKVARGKLREDVSRRYFRQLISAVDFCHSRGVSHRDLKPENLLLDHEGNLKVSDFGLSALPEQRWQDGLLHTQCGTPAYVAPEVLRKKGYDGAKADLWSCGVILYVLLAGFLPFRDENLMRMYRKVFRAEYEFPPWFTPGARRLISRLLVADPEKRITVAEIMQDPWFRKDDPAKSSSLFCSPVIPSTPNQSPPPKETEPEDPQQLDQQQRQLKDTPALYNAFDLISTMSSGLDLSGMFEGGGPATVSTAAAFTSRFPAVTIAGRLEEVGRELGCRVTRGGPTGFEVTMEADRSGRQGSLALAAEVFDVASGLAVVEFRRVAGDPLEYARLCQEGVRPALRDIVWTWQGDATAANDDRESANKYKLRR